MQKIKISQGSFYITESKSGLVQILDSDEKYICHFDGWNYGKANPLKILKNKVFDIDDFKTFLNYFILDTYNEFSKNAAQILIETKIEDLINNFNFIFETNYTLKELNMFINRIGNYYMIVDTAFVKKELEG